jgi:hypothetical protein
LYIALTIFSPRKRNLVLIGAIVISLLPSIGYFFRVGR